MSDPVHLDFSLNDVDFYASLEPDFKNAYDLTCDWYITVYHFLNGRYTIMITDKSPIFRHEDIPLINVIFRISSNARGVFFKLIDFVSFFLSEGRFTEKTGATYENFNVAIIDKQMPNMVYVKAKHNLITFGSTTKICCAEFAGIENISKLAIFLSAYIDVFIENNEQLEATKTFYTDNRIVDLRNQHDCDNNDNNIQ